MALPSGHADCAEARSRANSAARTAGVLAAPPLHLRHTAGCRPSVTPGTARHRLVAVTPADRTHVGYGPSSRRSSLEPGKITFKGTRCARVASAMALRATLDCDLARITSAPVGWMATSEMPQSSRHPLSPQRRAAYSPFRPQAEIIVGVARSSAGSSSNEIARLISSPVTSPVVCICSPTWRRFAATTLAAAEPPWVNTTLPSPPTWQSPARSRRCGSVLA